MVETASPDLGREGRCSGAGAHGNTPTVKTRRPTLTGQTGPGRATAGPPGPHPAVSRPRTRRHNRDRPITATEEGSPRLRALDRRLALGTGRRPRRDQGAPRPSTSAQPPPSTPTSSSASSETPSMPSAPRSAVLGSQRRPASMTKNRRLAPPSSAAVSYGPHPAQRPRQGKPDGASHLCWNPREIESSSENFPLREQFRTGLTLWKCEPRTSIQFSPGKNRYIELSAPWRAAQIAHPTA